MDIGNKFAPTSKIVVLRDNNRTQRLKNRPDLNEFDFDAGPVLQRFDRIPVESGQTSIDPDIQISIEDVHDDTVDDIINDKNVIAAAESMPITLLRNVEDAELEPSEIHADASNLVSDGGTTWGVRAIGAENSLSDGSRVTVAVLDTGIDRNHPAFSGVNLIEKNFTQSSDDDENGHGTHCAGTIFGRDVDGVRIGVAPGVRKALIAKVIGAGAGSAELIAALNWASDNGANVISMSLGFDFPAYQESLEDHGVPQLAATSMALQAYRKNLALFDSWMTLNDSKSSSGSGSVVVAASGNESRRRSSPSFTIAASSPSSANDVVSVGAVSDDGFELKVASFSNSGPQISGPGVSVISAKVGGGLKALNGTSMACPHVAGAAALVWEEMLDGPIPPSPTHVISRLLTNADSSILSPNGNTFSDVGTGLVKAP